jgi:hypothetical protein
MADTASITRRSALARPTAVASTPSTPIPPPSRWADEALDGIAAVYDAEVLRHGGTGWALLSIEARLALVAVYSAGRAEGGRQ